MYILENLESTILDIKLYDTHIHKMYKHEYRERHIINTPDNRHHRFNLNYH